MSVLQDFMEILTGHFNNQEQIEALQKQGITDFSLCSTCEYSMQR